MVRRVQVIDVGGGDDASGIKVEDWEVCRAGRTKKILRLEDACSIPHMAAGDCKASGSRHQALSSSDRRQDTKSDQDTTVIVRLDMLASCIAQPVDQGNVLVKELGKCCLVTPSPHPPLACMSILVKGVQASDPPES